jgi:KDO2-lipid IV(A) lauroyltransferase
MQQNKDRQNNSHERGDRPLQGACQKPSPGNHTHQAQSASLWQDKTLLHPKFWLTWVGLGLLRLIILLPWAAQRRIATAFSWLLFHLVKRRRLIAEKNIALCFPELDQQQQAQLVRDTFYENTLGLIETAHSFWAPAHRLSCVARFYGLPALQAALAAGKGVILVGAHYTTLDLGGRLFAQFSPVDVLYRPHKNRLFDQVLLSSRQRWATQVLGNKSLREFIRSLRQNHIFWYPADQDYGPENSLFVPFFGHKAATLSTTARLAKMTGAAVFVLGYHRRHEAFEYELHATQVDPTLTDEYELTQAVNQLLEQEIRRYPAQYMWVHRRFKTRPPGEAYLYER